MSLIFARCISFVSICYMRNWKGNLSCECDFPVFNLTTHQLNLMHYTYGIPFNEKSFYSKIEDQKQNMCMSIKMICLLRCIDSFVLKEIAGSISLQKKGEVPTEHELLNKSNGGELLVVFPCVFILIYFDALNVFVVVSENK